MAEKIATFQIEVVYDDTRTNPEDFVTSMDRFIELRHALAHETRTVKDKQVIHGYIQR